MRQHPKKFDSYGFLLVLMPGANRLPGPPGAPNIGYPPLLKEKKMRKLFGILLIVSLALALMTGLALANSVVNGDFQTGNLSGWTNHATASPRTGFLIGDTYYAQSDPTYHSSGTHFYESEMYQIVDVAKLSNGSANPNWNPSGTSESVSFSFNWTRPDSTIAEYQLYYWTGDGAPTTFNNDSPDSSWVKLLDAAFTDSTHSGTFTYSTTIANSQPEYFAVGLEGQSNRTFNYGTWQYDYFNATFDNVCLSTECQVVPLPPSVLLMGSGLLGLGLVGWRRKRD
jgi:hypothetical protein